MAHFDGNKPVTFSQARRGEVIVTQGFGNAPMIWRPSSGSFRVAGLPGPGASLPDDKKDQAAPQITVDTTDSFYVARIDILDGGGGFTKPPQLTVAAPSDPNGKQAKAVCRIANGQISEVEVTDHGSLYGDTPAVSVGTTGTIGTGFAATIQTAEIPDSGNTPKFHRVKGVTVTNPGSGYAVPPQTRIKDANGFVVGGLQLGVSGGQVFSKAIPTAIGSPPLTLEIGDSVSGTPNGAGNLLAIMRATFRGKYQCYYRWVDESVPKSEGGPIYSNLSPVSEVDAGHASSGLTWNIPESPPAGAKVELWRSSSNQATTLYKVATLSGTATFVDQINDNELTNPDRDGFSAMPILLPNGELNANRFGVPPNDFAVGVMFQDRFWMGVNTDNTQPNALRFSEVDEPESMPDVNELLIQQNLRAGDYITALIPYAGALLVCQSRHVHRLTYVSQPLIDVGIFMLAYRGCLNQRCWDIYEGRAYVMDDQGVYSLDPQGKVDGLTIGLDDLWQTKIDWNKRDWFIVRADRKLNTLRCSVAYHGDAGKYPTRQLCFSLDYKAWWEERHPVSLIGSTDCRTKQGNVALLYGTAQGKVYRLGHGLMDDAIGAVSGVTLLDPGRGYKRPPKITASGGSGAEFTCSLNSDGQIAGIQVRHCGHGYAAGRLVIDPPDAGGVQAVADFSVRDGEMPVHYSFRSGNMEFVSDAKDPRAAGENTRQVSMVYGPTKNQSNVYLETYYNGASYPRSNVARRDRGVGFVNSDEVPAAVLDMQATPIEAAESHGVARALFAGRTLSDMDGSDKHIAVGLSGRQDSAGQVVIHSLDIHGVSPQGG